MEAEVYERMAAVEAGHWWFRGRRQILENLLLRYGSSNGTQRILEAGCGTGGNLPMLARHGELRAFEPDPRARERARARGYTVEEGSLPEGCPFAEETFDWILMPDVLEHIEDDRRSLNVLSARLAPGGRLLLTVPAFSILWSRHDITHHHYRRYRKRQVGELLASAGLRVEMLSYYNCWLFPPILAVRCLKRLLQSESGDEDTIPPAALNKLLQRIFAGERHFLPRPGFPFGVSVIAMASRQA